MPICPKCDVAYLPGEQHVCGQDELWRQGDDRTPARELPIALAMMFIAKLAVGAWLPPAFSYRWEAGVNSLTILLPFLWFGRRNVPQRLLVSFGAALVLWSVVDDLLRQRGETAVRWVGTCAFLLTALLFALRRSRRVGS